MARIDYGQAKRTITYMVGDRVDMRHLSRSNRAARRFSSGRCDRIADDIHAAADVNPMRSEIKVEPVDEGDPDGITHMSITVHAPPGSSFTQDNGLSLDLDEDSAFVAEAAEAGDVIATLLHDLDELHGEARDAEARRRDLNRAGRRAVEHGKAVHQDQLGHHDRRRRVPRCAGPPGADRPTASPTAANAPPSTARVAVGCNLHH